MVSVIIPTLNPSKEIVHLFLSLQEQTVPCEIIVVDSSSKNGFVDLARSYRAKTITIDPREFDHGGTRTLAAHIASRDIVVYMTQDALLNDPQAIERLIEPFHHDARIAATFGRQLPATDATTFASHLRAFNYPEESYVRSMEDSARYGVKAAFISNGFAAYCKNALRQIGWFKNNLILCEDTYAGMKLLTSGYKIAYVSDAVVYHSHNYSIREEARRYFDIGVFHWKERGLLKDFGMPEKEGLRYVRSGLSYLRRNHQLRSVPAFLLRGVLKYAAYRLGNNYERLPKRLISKFSMHKNWWEKPPE